MADELTLEALRQKKKPVRKTIVIAGDTEAAELLEEAQEEVKEAEQSVRLVSMRQNNEEAILQAQARLEAAKSKQRGLLIELQPTLIKLVFQAIGPRRWDELVEEHRMSEQRRKDIAKETNTKEEEISVWDPETFPRALIALCLVEPKLTLDERQQWLNDDTWNGAEIQTMFATAMTVCTTRKIVDLGKG